MSRKGIILNIVRVMGLHYETPQWGSIVLKVSKSIPVVNN